MKLLPTKAHFGLQRYEQIFKLPNYKDSKKSTSWLNLQDIDFINIYSTTNTDLNAHLPPTQREGKWIASSLYSPHWKGPGEALYDSVSGILNGAAMRGCCSGITILPNCCS